MIKKMIKISFLCNMLVVQTSNAALQSPRTASPTPELARSASPTNAAHVRFDTLPPSLSKLPTPEQLRAIRARQQAATLADKKIEIGTIAAFHVGINQYLIYKAKPHNQIPMDEFYSKFPDVIETAKAQAQIDTALPVEEENYVYEWLEEDPTVRTIDHYAIVGEQPVLDGLQDQFFNISRAKRLVVNAAVEFINTHYQQVKSECVGKGLTTSSTSKKVRRVCPCGLQMDEPCWKACKTNCMPHCPNPCCQKIETITETGAKKVIMHPLNWTTAFYEERSKQKYIVKKPTKINDADCTMCRVHLRQELPKMLSGTKRSHEE